MDHEDLLKKMMEDEEFRAEYERTDECYSQWARDIFHLRNAGRVKRTLVGLWALLRLRWCEWRSR